MKRISLCVCSHQKNDFVDEAPNPLPEGLSLGPTLTDLPVAIIADILVRLPLRSVIVCKCLCKTLHSIISSFEFAKLHLDNAPVELMVRSYDANHVSRNLYLFDFDPEELDDKCCKCDAFSKPQCQSLFVADIKFKIPLRDAKKVLHSIGDGAPRRKYIACKPSDNKFYIVNSCNGLICLCDPKHRNPLVVCNPITGEFIKLPEDNRINKLIEQLMDSGFDRSFVSFQSGFGFYSKANKYLVVKIFKMLDGPVAQMHTLGTNTWESLREAPQFPCRLTCPTSVDGIYWLAFMGRLVEIVFFDLEDQKFHTVPSPPFRDADRCANFVSMQTLNGMLCILECVCYPFQLWVKKHGVGGDWTKLVSIDPKVPMGPCIGSYDPLKLSGKDGLLMSFDFDNGIYYYRKEKYEFFKYFDVEGPCTCFEIFPHKPSLISMKEALVVGDNYDVQNIYSRCGKLKLPEDDEIPFLANQVPEGHEPSSFEEDDREQFD